LFFEAKKESSVKWEEIRAQYTGQWLLIEYQELDEQLNVVAGEVVAHSPDKEEIYKRLLETKGKNIAIEYAGELSQNVAVMFRICPDIS
jgi:hypothetical protein